MDTKLSAEETERRLPYLELVDSISVVLQKCHELYAPKRSVVQLEHGSLLLMSAASRDLTITKLVTVLP